MFQYYQLVDVLWSSSPQDSYANQQPGQPGPNTSLSMSGATPDPSALPVANTTMETYVQNLTCLTLPRICNQIAGGTVRLGLQLHSRQRAVAGIEGRHTAPTAQRSCHLQTLS